MRARLTRSQAIHAGFWRAKTVMRASMRTPFAKCVAALVIACTLSLSVTSCSQPIDNGSKIPAQSQPFVALLALIGLGIGLTAIHHHNEKGAGPGPGPSVVAPNSIQGLGIGAF